ncbi:unnamed protein product [Moneuplotes crassus]|uniref:Histone acetyltransferase n=1 Tax=Euplotes crassus TaxID=5936 RepID=A0AAD1UIQ8_EUPCR|nr:unnamed protein product [Moneuplotes crassus]
MAQNSTGNSLIKFLKHINFKNTIKKHYSSTLNLEIRHDAYQEGDLIFAPLNNDVYQLAKIISCRVIEDFSESAKEGEDLEYYVHFEGYNRRNDKWVPHKLIYCDSEEVNRQQIMRRDIQTQQDQEEEFLPNDEDAGMDDKSIKAHEQSTMFRTIEWVQIGTHKCEAWYFSPYPEEYHKLDCLFICHYCLSYFQCDEDMERHSQRCDSRYPPGHEIYRDDKVSVFEVDGAKEPIYCENLSLVSKLFLDHKNLSYELSPFLFYCLCEYNDEGYQIAGYFSKEKDFSKPTDTDSFSPEKFEKERNYNNLSCILVFPFHQRKGYGKFLISFSYELGILEGRQGTPETPLSDLGHRTYISWWTFKLLTFLKHFSGEEISVSDISQQTGILQSDIIKLFESFKILRYQQGDHFLVTPKRLLKTLIKKAGNPGHPVNPELIHWAPFEFY